MMAIASEKIVSALHANWWLNLAGLLLSFAASVLLVRTVPPELFAQYAAVLAMIGVATLVFEAGANSGLTRYLDEARRQHASGTFYLRMQRRRLLATLVCGVVIIACGPIYARSTQLGTAAAQPWLFVLIAAIVAGTLTKLLAHYGLLALFETKTALLLQQGSLVVRSGAIALIAFAGGGLPALVAVLFAVTLLEAFLAHRCFWRLVADARAPISSAFVNRAQRFGLLTIFDKGCAMLGSGSMILLVVAPNHPAAAIAYLALAVELVGKAVSLTVMPMGNLVAPYLSQTTDDPEAQSLAIARVLKLSALLYAFTIGAALLLSPWFIAVLYSGKYNAAIGLMLLLLLPAAFENWVRGCCSPALLRNGRGRDLAKLNAVQAIATVATFAVVYEERLEIVIAAVGLVRSAVASLNLALLRTLVPQLGFGVPLQGALVALLSCAIAHTWGSALLLPPTARAVVQGLSFALLFYAGLRWVVFRDRDTLHLAHRITGSRAPLFARLLPPAPILNP